MPRGRAAPSNQLKGVTDEARPQSVPGPNLLARQRSLLFPSLLCVSSRQRSFRLQSVYQ